MRTTNQLADNRRRQRQIYGLPLAVVVYRIMARLRVSQAQIARTLGVSAPMLSQIVSADRVRLGDPGALARLVVLDRRSVDIDPLADRDPGDVDALLREIRALDWAPWRAVDDPQPQRRGPLRTPTPDHRRAG